MKRRLKLILYLAVSLLLLTQCQKPMGVLGKKKMREVTKDLILVEAYLQQAYQPDTVQLEYYERVFVHHGVTRAEYDSSFVWYSANPHKLADIYNQIKTELESSKAQLDTFLVDSVQRYRVRFEPIESLWANESRLYVPSSQTLFAYSQTVNGSDEFEPLDTLLWCASHVGPLPDSLWADCQLLITNQDGYRYTKVGSPVTIDVDSMRLISKLVLPDSLPPNGRYTLFILLHKGKMPLQLDQVRFKRLVPEEIETLNEELSTKEPIPDEMQVGDIY